MNILPADYYKVINKTILEDIDQTYLMTLYSPIIGPLAVSLYLNLWQDIKNNSDTNIHHHLMSNLKVSAKVLQNAREALEATGLIKTFVKISGNISTYIYELYSPLYPHEFLNHPILSIVLYNNVGKDEYEKIVKLFQVKRYDYSGFNEITKKIDEVYKVENYIQNNNIQDKEVGEIKLNSKIDYNLMIESIPKDSISPRAFTKKIKELIDNLSFIYNVDTAKMIEFVRKSITEYGVIDKTELRNITRKYYQLSTNSLPTVVYRTQPEYLKTTTNEQTLKDKVISMFENTSPYDFLKAKNKGGVPTSSELKLIEKLMIDMELPPAVINVLIDYSLNINNHKLTSSYVETIASQWRRAGIKTATEAMDFAKKEYKKNSTKKTSKKEVEKPVWIDQKIEKGNIDEEEAKRLENLLKEYE